MSRYTTGKRALKSHGLSETPIVWRNTSDTFTPRGLGYNYSLCELVKCLDLKESDGELRRSCLRRQPDCLQPCARLVIDTKKLNKMKAVLIVKFLTPQSLKNSTMQMYCTSLEPKRGLGQSADLSILTAIKYTLSQVKSLYDIRGRVMSAADITRAMLVDSNSMKGGPVRTV